MKLSFITVLCLFVSSVFAQTPKLLWELPAHATFARIQVSQDGRRCATSGSSDRTVKLWSLVDRKMLAKTCYIDPLFSQPNGDIEKIGVSISPRGEHIAAHGHNGGDSMATAPGAGRLDLWTLLAGDGYMERVVSWDLKRVAESLLHVNDTTWLAEWTKISVRDAETGDELVSDTFENKALRSPITSSDNKFAAYIDTLNKDVVLINLATATIAGIFKGSTTSILSIAFSLDGKTLTSFDTSGTVRRWDVESKALLSTISIPVESAISNDGVYYGTLIGKDSIGVFRCENKSFFGTVIDRMHGIYPDWWLGQDPYSIKLASDGISIFVLYHGIDTSILENYYWGEEVYVGVPNSEDRPQPLYNKNLGASCYARGGETICVVAEPNVIEERSLLTGTLLRTLTLDIPKGKYTYGLWSSRDMQSFYVGIADYWQTDTQYFTLEKYDAYTFNKLFSRDWDSLYIIHLVESPDGSIAYIHLEDNSLSLVKMQPATGDTLHFLNDTLQGFGSFDLSPDGKEIVITQHYKSVRRVDTETGELIKDLLYYSPNYTRYDPTGKFLLLSWPESHPAEATAYTFYTLYDIARNKLINDEIDRRILSPYHIVYFAWISDSVYIAGVPSRFGGWGDESGGIVVFNPFSESEAQFTFTPSIPSGDYWFGWNYGYNTEVVKKNGNVYYHTVSSDGTLSVWKIDGIPSSVAQQHSVQLANYPNPAENRITIQFPFTVKPNERFYVTDASGRSFRVSFTTGEDQTEGVFDISSLPSGAYMVRSLSHPSAVTQFIKQ